MVRTTAETRLRCGKAEAESHRNAIDEKMQSLKLNYLDLKLLISVFYLTFLFSSKIKIVSFFFTQYCVPINPRGKSINLEYIEKIMNKSFLSCQLQNYHGSTIH